MRELIVLIYSFAVLTTVLPLPTAQAVEKDGFNFYKDYLRARSDDGMAEGPANSERLLYFYRTPIQFSPGILPTLEQEYKKRTNAFKNHMLSKEMAVESEAPGKRSSKTGLAMYHAKQPRQLTQVMDILGLSEES